MSDVAVDAEDRVYVLTRSETPVLVYERDGTFLRAWGAGVFRGPHGITIGPDGLVYCVDNVDHTLRRFSPDGALLQTIGTPDAARAGSPFNRPTKACVLTDGSIFVSDGYGNSRVHRFSPAGQLQTSWGVPGGAPGEFRLPHGIASTRDEQRLLVCDRENDRIQVFDHGGCFLEEWAELSRPTAVAVAVDDYVYVSELGRPGGPSSRCSILDSDGRVLARIGDGRPPEDPGGLFAAHGVAVDSYGDVYVAEVTWAAGGKEGRVPPACHTLQKFARV